MTSKHDDDAAHWDEALRILQETGDPRPLGALLWRTTPDGNGATPLPTRVVYGLAALFATSNHRMETRLDTKPLSRREQETNQNHENIVNEMLNLIEGGAKVEAAAESAAMKLGISKRTALAAWTRARTLLPFVDEIARQRRKSRI